MVCVVYLLVVLLLTTSFTFIAGVSKDTCDFHILVGRNLTLALDHHKTLGDKDELRWTHNNVPVFHRRSKVTRIGKPTDIDAAGSLLLRDLNFYNAGVYKADVYNDTPVRVNGWSGRVCVMEKVSKPEVTFVCESNGAVAMLNCNVLNPRDVVFAWTHEGQFLKGETKPMLSVSLAKLKGNKDFSCSVKNAASQDQSNTVRLKCEPPPPVIYCFKAGTVMAAVAGGIGLILLLLIITIVSCYRQKKQTKPECQADLQMVPTIELRKTDHVILDYEVMHSGVSPIPSPKPSPRPSDRVNVLLSVAEGQEGHRTTAPEEKRESSPVPKPRTKVPQAAEKLQISLNV